MGEPYVGISVKSGNSLPLLWLWATRKKGECFLSGSLSSYTAYYGFRSVSCRDLRQLAADGVGCPR